MADLGAERLDGGREARTTVRLEVGVEHRQVGDVEVVDAQPRDAVLAHLRGWIIAKLVYPFLYIYIWCFSEKRTDVRTGADEPAVPGGLANGAADGGHAEDALRSRCFHA